MILTKQIEENFIDYDVRTRKKGEYIWDIEFFDDVLVYWNKKTLFGKIRRETKVYTFKRLNEGLGKYSTTSECTSFMDRLSKLGKNRIQNSNPIIKKLKQEFSGSDDFCLGVQHVLDVLEKEGLIKE